MKNINKLEELIREFDSNYSKGESENICVLESVNDNCLKSHVKKYLKLDDGEKPLFILNIKKGLLSFSIPFTGFVITNKSIHFVTLKNYFFSSLIPLKGNSMEMNLDYIDSLQIGELDSSFGSAYVGHQLLVNGQDMGLVRLGFGVTYDEEALYYINGLSAYLNENKLLTEAPKEFNWQ